MASTREPPPLFDDEDSRKDDENDIFASAVQSPMSDDAILPAAVQVTASSHPLFESNMVEGELSQERKVLSPNITASEDNADNFKHFEVEKCDSSEHCREETINDNVNAVSVSLSSENKAVDQVSNKLINNGDGRVNSKLSDFTNVLPDTDQIFNTSLTEEEVKLTFKNQLPFLSEHDTTEIRLDDKEHAQEISLCDDEDMFHSTAVDSQSIKQDSSSAKLTAANQLPTVGAPLSDSHSPPVISTSYSAATSASVSTSPTSPSTTFGTKTSPSNEEIEKEDGDTFITISVSEPQKIGDGMGSYMAYKLTTNTNIPYFRKKNWSVTRRFSDFLGLHSKLVEKHLHSGVIIPPAPEKAAIATTKIKLGSDKNSDFSSVEFIEKRRAALERYMNRTASHSKLRTDPDFREFIELDTELPKATQTSAISGAGVLRLFNRVGETVNKMAFKMDESDQWFEEKTQQIESLDNQLRKLHTAMEGLVGYRRELANATGSFSTSAAILSSVEEHSALSRALHQLSEATDRVHTIHHAQADADFYHLSETTKDYINIIGAVKEVFHERVKTYQTWQHALVTLAKKRENKAKTELSGRLDKVEQASDEVREWEVKVERSQEEFDRISKAIKVEMEQFDVIRVVDFKEMLIKYLEALIASQLQIVKVWETFLPEAKAIA